MVRMVWGAEAHQLCAGLHSRSTVSPTRPRNTTRISAAERLRGRPRLNSASTGVARISDSRNDSATGTNAAWPTYRRSPRAMATSRRSAPDVRPGLVEFGVEAAIAAGYCLICTGCVGTSLDARRGSSAVPTLPAIPGWTCAGSGSGSGSSSAGRCGVAGTAGMIPSGSSRPGRNSKLPCAGTTERLDPSAEAWLQARDHGGA